MPAPTFESVVAMIEDMTEYPDDTSRIEGDDALIIPDMEALRAALYRLWKPE